MCTRVLFVAGVLFTSARTASAQLIHGRIPQPVQHGTYVEALRVASFTIEDGRYVLTSDWTAPPALHSRGQIIPVFDCIEMNPNTAEPVSDCPPFGCASIGQPCERYYSLGSDFHNPLVANDFVFQPVTFADVVTFAWVWGGDGIDDDGDGVSDERCYVGVITFEDGDTAGCSNSG